MSWFLLFSMFSVFSWFWFLLDGTFWFCCSWFCFSWMVPSGSDSPDQWVLVPHVCLLSGQKCSYLLPTCLDGVLNDSRVLRPKIADGVFPKAACCFIPLAHLELQRLHIYCVFNVFIPVEQRHLFYRYNKLCE